VTVRAIDMITMLPRTGEAGRMQQQSQMHPHLQQQAQSAQEQARAQRAQSQVARKPEAEQASVRKDGGGRQGGGGQQPRHPRQAPAGEGGQEPPAEPGVGRRLDVKL
jgi:hypothetical protein